MYAVGWTRRSALRDVFYQGEREVVLLEKEGRRCTLSRKGDVCTIETCKEAEARTWSDDLCVPHCFFEFKVQVYGILFRHLGETQ